MDRRGDRGARRDVTEMDMMGGHQFLLGGRIIFGVRADTLSVRVAPEQRDVLLERRHVAPMRLGARTTKRFVRVSRAGWRSARAFDEWIAIGLRSAG
jgi:hypothetical protein